MRRYPRGGPRLVLGSIVWIATTLAAIVVGAILVAGGADDGGSGDSRIAGGFFILIGGVGLSTYLVMLKNRPGDDENE